MKNTFPVVLVVFFVALVLSLSAEAHTTEKNSFDFTVVIANPLGLEVSGLSLIIGKVTSEVPKSLREDEIITEPCELKPSKLFR